MPVSPHLLLSIAIGVRDEDDAANHIPTERNGLPGTRMAAPAAALSEHLKRYLQARGRWSEDVLAGFLAPSSGDRLRRRGQRVVRRRAGRSVTAVQG